MDYVSEFQSIEQTYQSFQPATEMELATKFQGQKDQEIQQLKMAQAAEKAENSFMGRIGTAIAPFFHPVGIDWKGGVALLTGFVAKEIVVSTLGVLYAAADDASEPDALKKALLASDVTPLSAFAMMVFVLLYLPCLATVAAIRRETRSLRWMFFSIAYTTSLAWVMSFLVYQGGKLIGFS